MPSRRSRRPGRSGYLRYHTQAAPLPSAVSSRKEIWCRSVAQSGSALAWGARGPEFKSRRSDQLFSTPGFEPVPPSVPTLRKPTSPKQMQRHRGTESARMSLDDPKFQKLLEMARAAIEAGTGTDGRACTSVGNRQSFYFTVFT